MEAARYVFFYWRELVCVYVKPGERGGEFIKNGDKYVFWTHSTVTEDVQQVCVFVCKNVGVDDAVELETFPATYYSEKQVAGETLMLLREGKKW